MSRHELVKFSTMAATSLQMVPGLRASGFVMDKMLIILFLITHAGKTKDVTTHCYTDFATYISDASFITLSGNP